MALVDCTAGGSRWTFEVERDGSGPAVLLLHGLLTDSRVWRPLREALADRYTLVCVDAPGHGGSPARDADFRLEEEVDALVALLDTLGVPGPVAWVGHSMGGMKAMRAALRHPDRVAALGLISTQPYLEPDRTAAPYLAMVEAAQTWGVDIDLAEVIGKLNFGKAYLASDAGQEWVRHFTRVTGDALAPTAHSVFRREDISERMGELTAPTLIVHGTEDIPIRIKVARSYAELVPAARMVELDGCGHTPPCERPDAVAALLGEFLDGSLRAPDTARAEPVPVPDS
ncbi:MAG: alpha/beta fold hydrolase [Actinocatenispora sp.]